MAISKLRPEDVIDIRTDKNEQCLLQQIMQGLMPGCEESKTMPTLVLYDEQGLKLFEEITYVSDYYLTNAEIETLEAHARKIVGRIPDGAQLIELGSGIKFIWIDHICKDSLGSTFVGTGFTVLFGILMASSALRKVEILFRAFEDAGKKVDYYALDLSLRELQRTFTELPFENYKCVTFHALHGTYEDGLAWLSKPENRKVPTCLMSLGSSIGNFSREEAIDFLAQYARVFRPEDLLIVGLDACQEPERVYKAYNDSQKVTEKFYRNGLDHANNLIGRTIFRQEDWVIEGVYNESQHRHEAYYVALNDIRNGKFVFEKGEKVLLEYAYKYSEAQSDKLWHSAGFVLQLTSPSRSGDYNVHLLSAAHFKFPDRAAEYAAKPVPSLEDWELLWTAWDVATRSMVPRDELLNKPIQLRNNLIFYLGHIPTFADIHMVKATNGKPTDPASYVLIFERGIDPDVDNPELCHAHSEIPSSWPPLQEILDYQSAVRARISSSTLQANTNRKLGRGLWLAFEHEAMHLETFLYMLLQSDKVLPPPGRERPDFKTMALEAQKARVPNKWHKIPATQIKLGLDDPENDLGPDRYFGWDNERPSRIVSVPAFESQSRPISNGEYAEFLEKSRCELFPASWVVSAAKDTQSGVINGSTPYTNGNGLHQDTSADEPSQNFMNGKSVRSVFGLVPLAYALDWPVMASYAELAAFAKWSNGRIPTLEEVKSIYEYAEVMRSVTPQVRNGLISAVNGHLSNNGVEETPPPTPCQKHLVDGNAGLDSKEIFLDMQGCNVGFKNWHPTPVTQNGERLCGQGDVGGLWEFTSTKLASFEGFKAMDLYPGYTADFFDGKHNICLGGSWATVPRIAGRKSFVNWYQFNYPYVWATARLVRDV